MRFLIAVSVIAGIALVLFGASLLATSSGQTIHTTGRIVYPNGDSEPANPDLTGLVPVSIGIGFIVVAFISRVLR